MVAEPAKMIEPQVMRFTSAGLSLNAWQWPNPGKPILLLMHGGRDHARSWDYVVAALGADYHVIAPDLRGHGDSDWSPEGHYALADHVLDLAALVEQLPPGPLTIVAHSLGGNIALRLAGIWPDRFDAIAGIECLELPLTRSPPVDAIALAELWREWIEQRHAIDRRAPRHYPSIAAAAQRMSDQFPTLDAALVDHLARHAVRESSDGWSWKYDNRSRLRPPDDIASHEFDALLANVRCPVQLFYGDQSWVPLPSPDRLALLPSIDLRRITGAGHWLHHERLAEFVGAVRPFLDQALKGQR